GFTTVAGRLSGVPGARRASHGTMAGLLGAGCSRFGVASERRLGTTVVPFNRVVPLLPSEGTGGPEKFFLETGVPRAAGTGTTSRDVPAPGPTPWAGRRGGWLEERPRPTMAPAILYLTHPARGNVHVVRRLRHALARPAPGGGRGGGEVAVGALLQAPDR